MIISPNVKFFIEQESSVKQITSFECKDIEIIEYERVVFGLHSYYSGSGHKPLLKLNQQCDVLFVPFTK
ncbi:MAG TPA: hypothetical protein PLM49_08780, partial [Bacteroidales bacterium]|nr:hypothetical protein [Bacteroidales bacterium]